MLLTSIKDGDFTGIRKNFQKLSSLYLGERAIPPFANVTLIDLTASQLLQTDADKKLTSIALPLIVAKGGTGAATLTDGGILLGSGTGAITALGVATNGQIPIGDNSTDPILATITGTANQIVVTNAAGSITLSLPQDYDTGATPILGGLTVTNACALGSNSAIFKPATDSTTFFQVHYVGGSTPILNVDTTNKSVSIGTATSTSLFTIKQITPDYLGGLHFTREAPFAHTWSWLIGGDDNLYFGYATDPSAAGNFSTKMIVGAAGGIGVGVAPTLGKVDISSLTNYGIRVASAVPGSAIGFMTLGAVANVGYLVKNNYYSGAAWLANNNAVGSNQIAFLSNGNMEFKCQASGDGEPDIGMVLSAVGNLDVVNNLTAGTIQADDGFSGSWVNNEGDTVTIVGGIITSVAA